MCGNESRSVKKELNTSPVGPRRQSGLKRFYDL